ncbi:hypothetical protein [Microbacterium sp. J1-1]|uniref:hypothetical protein n=1 Tax=Microbacterium sp. J1-1 TaxID=2992441 RepID=UPI0021158488|nr:hypothetical protein [Microbacterium sp. J1-1]UUE19320.1 hypothetical protein LRQ07_10915 [Microbacterium sp. J1-1]
MAVSLTATLLAASQPRPVQVALTGTTAGQAYEVVGTSGDGGRWQVPGGVGVSEGSQILLIDSRAALNTPIVYSAVVDGVTVTAAPVTVSHDGVAVIQTIDGLTVAPVEVASTTEPRSATIRSEAFEIAGRPDPAARLETPGSYSYGWEFDTQGVDSVTMRAILESGMPIVRRLVPGMRDLTPVVLGLVTSWKDELITEGGDTWRRWSLGVRELTDPQPSTALIAFTWPDFDDAMLDRVWSWHSLFPSTSGWAATNGTLSNPATGGYSTPRHLRASATAAATAVDIFASVYTGAAPTLGEPVVPGMQVTVTCRVKGTAGRSGMAALKWSNGTVITGTPVVLTGDWQQVVVTATAPAGVTGLAPGARMAATGVAAGHLLDYSAPTISKGASVPVGTFDELFDTWDDFDRADWSTI